MTLFLAGPFDDDDGGPEQRRSWRDDVLDAVADLDVDVFDPRNGRWREVKAAPPTPGTRGSLDGMYDWQLGNAVAADVVLVWIPAGRHAPTALLQLGHLAAKRGNPARGSSVVVGGDGLDGLHQTFARLMRLFPAGRGQPLDHAVRLVRIQLEKALRAKAIAPAKKKPASSPRK